MRDRMWILVVLAVALVALAACGATEAPPPTQAPAPTEAPAEAPEAKTLKIGTLVSLEFPLGVDMQKELDALVPVLNEQGGIKVGDEQYQIEIILYDTKLNPETGRAGAERLVFEDEVDFILGDETTDAWLSVTEPEKVLVVSMSPSPAVLDPQFNYVFQAGTITSGAGAMWGWLAENHPELKTVVAMFPDDGKGQAEAGMLEQIAAAYGFELLDVSFYEPGTTDFSTYATHLATLDPDVYTTAAGGPVQDALSMRAMREAGWDGQIFLKTTLSPQKMSEIIDLSLVEGTIAGMAGTTVPEPPPIAQELIDAYTDAYGTWDSPEVLHVLTFYVLKAAIEEAGSLDVDAVAAAMLDGLEFDSPAGHGITASRPDMGNERATDTVYGAIIGQIVDGEAVVIDTVPIDKVIEYNNLLRGLE